MSPEAKQKIQLALLAALVVATIRAGVIFYDRHEERIAEEKAKHVAEVGYSNADYYVNPKKLYPHDIKSAKELPQQPAWMREGYHSVYYRYDPRKGVDFSHEAGLIGPIEKLKIIDVVTASAPGVSQRQVMAVIEKDGNKYAFPIGIQDEGEYKIYSDDMLFIEDPHELYKHWPADIWQAVDQHEVKPGMSELQANFALGMGVPDSGGSTIEKTVRYPDGGKPMVVVFHDGKAVEIHPDAAAPK